VIISVVISFISLYASEKREERREKERERRGREREREGEGEKETERLGVLTITFYYVSLQIANKTALKRKCIHY